MLDASATFPSQFVGKGANQGPYNGRGVAIYPQPSTGAGKLFIATLCVTSSSHFLRFASASNAMIPRIHLIKVSIPVRKATPIFK